MARRQFGELTDQTLRGRVFDEAGWGVPAEGAIRAAGAFAPYETLTGSRSVSAPAGGVFLIEALTAAQIYEIGNPRAGSDGRTLTFIMNNAANAGGSSITLKVRSNTTNLYGVLMRGGSNAAVRVSGNTDAGFQGGSATNRASRGDWIEFRAAGDVWLVRGQGSLSNPFHLA